MKALIATVLLLSSVDANAQKSSAPLQAQGYCVCSQHRMRSLAYKENYQDYK
jgi:hypothetical protein